MGYAPKTANDCSFMTPKQAELQKEVIQLFEFYFSGSEETHAQ